jgi:hypothetical protein
MSVLTLSFNLLSQSASKKVFGGIPMLKCISVLRETPKPRRKSGKVKEEKEKKEIKVEVEVEVKEEENEIREDEEPPRK